MHDKLRSLRDSAEFAEEKLVASAQSLLEEILEERGLNKSDLAKKMGVSKARVSQIFSDNQNFTFRLIANAFHSLGEELYLGRESQRIQHKSLDAADAGCSLSFDDRTREISHGFEWLDRQIELGGQPIQAGILSKHEMAGILEDALNAAFERSGETKVARQSRERDHDRATTLDWSRTNDGSNVIPMARKRA